MRPCLDFGVNLSSFILFRSSRPDYIETFRSQSHIYVGAYCSGLLGRTTLRRKELFTGNGLGCRLFRSSRPDYIETGARLQPLSMIINCSGLLGRTTLRRWHGRQQLWTRPTLFRSSRPDYIETRALPVAGSASHDIVPVF